MSKLGLLEWASEHVEVVTVLESHTFPL